MAPNTASRQTARKRALRRLNIGFQDRKKALLVKSELGDMDSTFHNPVYEPMFIVDTTRPAARTQLTNFTQPKRPLPSRRYTSKNHIRHPLPDERFSVFLNFIDF
jgi:hypothetical protein